MVVVLWFFGFFRYVMRECLYGVKNGGDLFKDVVVIDDFDFDDSVCEE